MQQGMGAEYICTLGAPDLLSKEGELVLKRELWLKNSILFHSSTLDTSLQDSSPLISVVMKPYRSCESNDLVFRLESQVKRDVSWLLFINSHVWRIPCFIRILHKIRIKHGIHGIFESCVSMIYLNRQQWSFQTLSFVALMQQSWIGICAVSPRFRYCCLWNLRLTRALFIKCLTSSCKICFQI